MEETTRGIFGTKMEETTRGWRKPHTKDLHNLHSSANIIKVIKRRRTGWRDM
jgi:hypothetical protein